MFHNICHIYITRDDVNNLNYLNNTSRIIKVFPSPIWLFSLIIICYAGVKMSTFTTPVSPNAKPHFFKSSILFHGIV